MRYGPQSKAAKGRQDTGYVSEFSEFMEHFLEEHPEEVDERLTGRSLYWDHKVDRGSLDRNLQDNLPDDRYGFDYSAWRTAKKQGSSG